MTMSPSDVEWRRWPRVALLVFRVVAQADNKHVS